MSNLGFTETQQPNPKCQKHFRSGHAMFIILKENEQVLHYHI